MNRHRFITLLFLSLLFISYSCKNSLIVNKRQHQKGYYIAWSKNEIRNRSDENISKESIQKEINKIDEIFSNIEDSNSAYIAQVESKQPEISETKNENPKHKNDFNFYDILNQNTKAYTSSFSIQDLKDLGERIKEEQRSSTFNEGVEIIIYFTVWVGLIVAFFFIEPIVAWVLLGILLVVIILIIWALAALGKALRDFNSHCRQSCHPPSGCH